MNATLISNVPDSDLLHVAITGPDISGARAELHIPTRRIVADYLDYDRSTSKNCIVLGESVDSLRSRGYNYIAIAAEERHP